MEDTFIKIGKGENQGCLTEKIYKLDPMKKNLIENFLYARENMILLAKGTVGVDGKTTLIKLQDNLSLLVMVQFLKLNVLQVSILQIELQLAHSTQ